MASPGWLAESAGGITLLRCEALSGVPGVAHAFSTRQADGADRFDLGRADADDPGWTANRSRFCAAAGIAQAAPAILEQVHGTTLVPASACAADPPQRADGVVGWREDGASVAPAVRVADCVPILIASRDGAAIAAVHAGWRGTAGRIAARAVERLGTRGSAPGELVAALGPAIGACCYEVGDDVAGAVAASAGAGPAQGPSPVVFEGSGGRPMLDLRGANRLQLLQAGLAPGSIHTAPWCTACGPEWFYSYRREGARTGRLLAAIGWSGTSGPAST